MIFTLFTIYVYLYIPIYVRVVTLNPRDPCKSQTREVTLELYSIIYTRIYYNTIHVFFVPTIYDLNSLLRAQTEFQSLYAPPARPGKCVQYT